MNGAVPAGEGAKLKSDVVRPDPLVAPFSKGQTVGALRVLRGDQALFEVPVVALEAVYNKAGAADKQQRDA